jgi:hypothetical protein
VVGNGQGFHPIGGSFFIQPSDLRCSVKQGELGMYVEVVETRQFEKLKRKVKN